jgi:hypothetical protein
MAASKPPSRKQPPATKRKVVEASTAKKVPKWAKQLRKVLAWGAVTNQPLAECPLPLTRERLVRFIARELRETEQEPIRCISAIVRRIGSVPALNVMIRTVQIQSAGGLERDDRKGRRTAGGIFFYLTRSLWGGKHWAADSKMQRALGASHISRRTLSIQGLPDSKRKALG